MGRRVKKMKKILMLDFNLTQRGNLAKFLYDVAKLGFGGVVITGFMSDKIVWWKLIAGIFLYAMIPALAALYFESEEKGDQNG